MTALQVQSCHHCIPWPRPDAPRPSADSPSHFGLYTGPAHTWIHALIITPEEVCFHTEIAVKQKENWAVHSAENWAVHKHLRTSSFTHFISHTVMHENMINKTEQSHFNFNLNSPRTTLSFHIKFSHSIPKLQALAYDVLPSTTAVFSYAIGSRKMSANEQFLVGAQIGVRLLQTTQIKQGASFITTNKVYTTTNKTTIIWIETELFYFFYTRGGCVSCLRACFGTRLLLQSYQDPNLSEGADRVAGQMHGDKRVPLQWRN